MKSDTFELRAEDGASIHIHRWLPEGEIRAIVQVAHGLAEHGARYARFAEALTSAGYAVYADDHRGHGKTAAADLLGHFADKNGWSLVLSDLRALGAKAKSEHPGKKLILMGHSMGSFFTQQMLQKHAADLDAVILSGTNAPGSLLERLGIPMAKLERARKGPRGTSKLLTFLSFGAYNDAFKPARTDFDWLSKDNAEVDQYIADPLCGADATTQLWVDLLEGLQSIATSGFGAVRKDLPIYLFAGDKDPVGKAGKGVTELYERLLSAGLQRVTIRLYPGGRHEMLNETNRDEVMGDVLAFLETV